MFLPEVILGPPGCGKTSQLMSLFTEELARGVPPERIALVAFPRAAREEAMSRALKRFAFAASRFVWLRTIHSASFRLLELSHGQILDERRLAEFAAQHGYELTVNGHRLDALDVEPMAAVGSTRDDALLFVYEWGRNNLLDPEQSLSRCPVDDISASQFRLFVRRLEQFKREHGLFDFTDLLEQVLKRGLRPDVDVAMIDEAHDLSPLQIAVVEAWFASCPRSYVCADDDQAIYGWQGASPNWVRELAGRSKPTVLTVSKRVPILPHALAQRIISGNDDRVVKRYEPKDKIGRILRMDFAGAMALAARSTDVFVLCRNRIFIRGVANELAERGVPYLVEGWGGRCPLGDERLVRAVKLVLALKRGEAGPFPSSAVAALAHTVSTTCGLVSRAAVEQIDARKGQGSFMRAELVDQLGLVELLQRIESDAPLSVLDKLRRDDRRYFEKLIATYGTVPDPSVVVTTIHSAKGRERELVIVLPNMTRTTHQSYLRRGSNHNETENRVFYVAVTRTKDTLVLVDPTSRRNYQFPTFAFAEGLL
ncbi:MAG: ATP-dependent helicase [Sandaracinaceae bacterium]|nr:ATP-dependent helicase [Sandaracinaceae bacterium]